LGQHSPSVEPFAPHRFAILLHLRTSRDFVSRRSAYTPNPASLRPGRHFFTVQSLLRSKPSQHFHVLALATVLLAL
jgi:hypothetical protein